MFHRCIKVVHRSRCRDIRASYTHTGISQGDGTVSHRNRSLAHAYRQGKLGRAKCQAVKANNSFWYPQRIAYLIGRHSESAFIHPDSHVPHAAEQGIRAHRQVYLRLFRTFFLWLETHRSTGFTAENSHRVRQFTFQLVYFQLAFHVNNPGCILWIRRFHSSLHVGYIR